MSEEATQAIETRVKDIVVEVLRVNRNDLVPSTHLMKDLGADSLHALDVAVRIEKVFNIQIPDESFKNFLTISDIVRGIVEHTSVSSATITG